MIAVLQHGVLAVFAISLVLKQRYNLLIVGLCKSLFACLVELVAHRSALISCVDGLNGISLTHSAISLDGFAYELCLASLVVISPLRVDLSKTFLVVRVLLGLASEIILIVLNGLVKLLILQIRVGNALQDGMTLDHRRIVNQ